MVASEQKQEECVSALLAEIRATEVTNDYEVVSIFFGGGTPSILKAEVIGEILAEVRAKFQFGENVEITIECNPGTVDKEKLFAYKQFGINRLSFGLQSTDDSELGELGRIHTYEEFCRSFEDARDVGFDNISVDLMSGLPGQSVTSWQKTLKSIGELNPEHISAYSLIVEEGTPFAKRELKLPSEEKEREMYEQTNEILADFDYHQYEISNYSKIGYECRHNLGYWIRRDYLGFGVAAASLFCNVRYSNVEDLEMYIANSSELPKIRCDVEFIDEKAGMEEFIFLGLRMMQGINDTEFKEQFDVSLRAVYGDEIDKLVEQGLLDFDEHDLKLTRRGISVSNYVFAEMLACET